MLVQLIQNCGWAVVQPNPVYGLFTTFLTNGRNGNATQFYNSAVFLGASRSIGY
jgi:hypothetical protein